METGRPAAGGAPARGGMSQPIRVLLVDNEPDFLETISFWLRAQGYLVNQAPDGESAVRLAADWKPDVIFLDVLMPGMDGIETLRRIRAIDKQLPVILVTASALTDENKYAGARALGISGLFPKGSSHERLSQILQVALRRLRRPAAGNPPPAGPLARLREALEKLRKPPPPPPG